MQRFADWHFDTGSAERIRVVPLRTVGRRTVTFDDRRMVDGGTRGHSRLRAEREVRDPC